MSDNSVNLLAKLIEMKPDGEDEKWKFILLGDSKIYAKDGKVFCCVIILAFSLLMAILYKNNFNLLTIWNLF